MKTKLRNLISRTITGEWGYENNNFSNVIVIRAANFNNDGTIDFSNLVERAILKKEKENGKINWRVDFEKIEAKKIIDDDIIIEKSGGGPNSPVGRIVYFKNPGNKTYLCNNFTQILRADKSKINPMFLYYNLQYLYKTKRVLKYQNQTTGLINLKVERYLQEEVTVPLFDIQLKVITQLQIIQELIDNRKKSIHLIDKLVFSKYIEMFGNPINNPKNFKTKKLSEIGICKTGGTPSTDNSKYYNGNINWFTSGELNDLFIYESKKKITQEAIEKSNSKIIPINSILIGMYDTAAFKMSINKVECSCNQAILYSKLHDDFYKYLTYYSLLLSKDYYLNKRKGARQKNLNATFIKNIKIIHPVDKESKELITKFNSIVEQNYTQKLSFLNSLQNLELLFQSVLINSFSEKIKINEKSIFDDLIKQFTINDLKDKKERLQYLKELFTENKFNDVKSYNNAKEKLFELFDEDVFEQTFDGDKINLNVK
ncbi:restriction endonuclease subunit S [Flavobacterium frigidarium]|uniref:Restriction endonuclease subunit S n=1 Tax=Flavobacterium frigidarium TaxID=99286 RepID=A0ABV4KGQ9_9FLAO